MPETPDNGFVAAPADDSPISDEPVAAGDRRAEVHYEADPDQLVQVSHSHPPSGPLPEEMAETGGHSDPPPSPAGDVAITPAGPSVWDARPTPGPPENSADPA